MKGPHNGLLYILQGKTLEIGVAMVADEVQSDKSDLSALWHKRLGHLGEKTLQGLIKQGCLKGAKIGKMEFYEHYILGKQTKVKFGSTVNQMKGILDYVHSDVWGPAMNASLGGKRWFVSFIDDYSHKSWI